MGLLNRSFQKGPQYAGRNRLFEEPICLQIVNDRYGMLHRSHGGQNDSGNLFATRAKLFEQGESVHAGHDQIGQDRIRAADLQFIESVLAIDRGGYVVAERRDHSRHIGPLGFIVIDD